MRVSTALVVSGGGLQGAALVKSLRAMGDVRVLVADCHDENVGRFEADGYLQAPLLADTTAFSAFLRRVCRDEQVDHLLPTTDLELAAFVSQRTALEAAGTRVWVSSAEALALARDKLALAAWLAARNLPSLPTWSEPEAITHNGPLIGKPRAGYGSRGIVKLDSRADAIALPAAACAGLAWQPLLDDFDEYSIDFAITAPGVVSPAYVRRRIRTSGGYAVLCEPGADTAVQTLAERAVLGLSEAGALGVLNLQVLVEHGRAWVSDFNARAGMSLPLTLVAGGNPVALLFGRPCPPQAQPAAGEALRTVRTLHERLLRQPALPRVRGVVFDLDDTLFDQKHWIADKLRLTWQQCQAELPPEPAFMRDTLAILEEGERATLFDAYARRLGRTGPAGDAWRWRLIEAFRAARPAVAHLYDDVAGCLAQLRRRGLRLALLTDNPAASQQHKIDCAGLAPAFDAVVLTAKIGGSGAPKPDAAAFHAAAVQLDLAPEQLVMVGDHLFRDSLGALNAGYAHAFHIQRAGAFFNFDLALCAPLLPAGRLTVLQALTELDALLPARGAE